MAEKAKYLEAARRQLDRTQAVDNKKAEEKVRKLETFLISCNMCVDRNGGVERNGEGRCVKRQGV